MLHEQYIKLMNDQRYQKLHQLKHIQFFQDKNLDSENSDDEEIKQKKEFKISQKKKKKVTWQKKTLGLMLITRKSSGMNIIAINWVKLQLRIKNIWKKLIKQCKFEKPYILSPDGSLRILWDILCLCLVIFEMISIPLQISFEIEISEIFVQTSTALFIFDIFLNFNTGTFQDGILKMQRKLIIKEYLKFWFWIDSFSAFPYDLILDEESGFASSAKLLRLLRFLRFIKVLKFLRLAKLKKILDSLSETFSIHSGLAAFLTFIKLFLFVLFFAHLLGCIFHFTAQQEDNDDSWLGDLRNSPWYIRYVTSLYWGVLTMTTIGYGDISPQTATERLLGIILLLIACGGFAFTMNSIGFALDKINEKEGKTKERLNRVNKYMKKVKIPDILQNKIRKYLEYVWERNEGVVLQTITDTLSVELSTELYQHVNGKLFGYIDIFWQNHTYDFLIKYIMPIMKEKVYFPQEIIFDEQQQESYDIYMIQQGEVDIYYQKTDITIDKKLKNDFFGEISFYSNQIRSASSKSVDFSNIFRINSLDFIHLARTFSHDLQTYFSIRHKIIFEKDYSSINIRCYVCQMDDHIARDCPSLHFQVYISEAPHYLQFLQQAKHVQQSLFIRKDRVDYNARFHCNIISASQTKYLKTEKKIEQFQTKKQIPMQSLDQLEMQSVITDDEDYNAINQMNKLEEGDKRFKTSVRLQQKTIRNINPRPTKKITTLLKQNSTGMISVSCQSSDDQIGKAAIERINKYLQEFQKNLSLTRKREWKEFCSIPNFEKFQEYTVYYPESNISKIIPQYQRQKAKIITDVQLNHQNFGEEEFYAYSQYYCYDLEQSDIHFFFRSQVKKNSLSFEEQRILKLERRIKKLQQYIRKPPKMKSVLLAVKATRRLQNSQKHLTE